MSRSRKKLSWYRSPDGWTGRKQRKRDDYRDKGKYIHNRGGGHDNYWHLTRKIFSKGYSLEEMRKILIEKHKCKPCDANNLVNKFNDYCRDSFKIMIVGLVCVNDNYVIPAATANMEPYFEVMIDLPIYFYRLKNGGYFDGNSWAGGNIIYKDNKIYKYSPKDLLDKERNSRYNRGEIYNSPIEVWPNEKIAALVGEAINMHLESGMIDCQFRVHGWKKLYPTIEKI